jgi:hypothetical protein
MWNLRFFGIPRNVGCWLDTDVSVQRIDPILNGWRVYPETSVRIYNCTLSKIPKECRSHLHRDESLKSHVWYMSYVVSKIHFIDTFVITDLKSYYTLNT